MIGIFATRASDLERVSHLLQREGRQITTSTSWAAFLAALPDRESAVVAVPWLDWDLPATELRRMVQLQPWRSPVLLTEPDPQNLRLLGRTGFTEVLFLGKEEHKLPDTLRRVKMNGFFARIGEAIRKDHSLPVSLRAALLLALEQEPPTGPLEPEDPIQPVRSVRSLARRLSHSEDHLARLARGCGFDLRTFLDWCVALRALHLHWGCGEKWESIAWRFGYASVSGLSEQLKHTLGRRPRDISVAEMELYFQEFEQRFAPPLGPPPRNF